MVKISMFASSKYGSVDIEDECPREELLLVLTELFVSMRIAVKELKKIKEEVEPEEEK